MSEKCYTIQNSYYRDVHENKSGPEKSFNEFSLEFTMDSLVIYYHQVREVDTVGRDPAASNHNLQLVASFFFIFHSFIIHIVYLYRGCMMCIPGEEETGAPLFFRGRKLFPSPIFLTSKCSSSFQIITFAGRQRVIGKPWTSFQASSRN